MSSCVIGVNEPGLQQRLNWDLFRFGLLPLLALQTT